ncbi:MAG TPA: nuclear transport factor 2 family protein [Burkholderiaceae bacterium]
MVLLLISLATAAQAAPDLEALRKQVWATECAFARSMAERDFKDFEALLSEQAVFFSGPTPLHGKAQVAVFWKRFYGAGGAPFAWEPDEVVVLADGTLAHSSGPVVDPKGQPIGRFFSIWRQEAPGKWRIVFDRGGPPGPAASASAIAATPKTAC